MAKLTKSLNDSFESVQNRVVQGVLNASTSATVEETCEWRTQHARCWTGVFERYSYIGKNRVSMSVTLFQSGNGPVQVCAITSGGSQALFFKINTWGEESFLETLENVLL